MKKLLVATKNPGKLADISKFLSSRKIQCVSLKDLSISEDVTEDGKDYYENSKKKALFYAKLSGLPTVADDAGLEINALNGEPGHKARRWLGYEATDEELIAHMEKVTKTLPDNNRNARYKAVITFALPNGKYFQEEGITKGIISDKKSSKVLPGYPYDSFFYIPEIKSYYHGALSPEQEKIYNHRYIAVQKLKPFIEKYA